MDIREIYKQLNESLSSKLPDSALEQLRQSSGDVEFCKILADCNVDLEQFESAIKNSGLPFPADGSELTEQQLEAVSGGWVPYDMTIDVCCPNCGSSNRDDHSYQYFRNVWEGVASLFDKTDGEYYRCKKCGHYFSILHGKIIDRGV